MTSYGQAEIIEDRPAETLEVKENLLDKFCKIGRAHV
jgi:hypothetical protein